MIAIPTTSDIPLTQPLTAPPPVPAPRDPAPRDPPPLPEDDEPPTDSEGNPVFPVNSNPNKKLPKRPGRVNQKRQKLARRTQRRRK